MSGVRMFFRVLQRGERLQLATLQPFQILAGFSLSNLS